LALAVVGTTSPALARANSIVDENEQPGTTEWFVAAPAQAAIAGYAGRLSYLPGQPVTLYVDSGGAPFTYTVYRMGDYAGLGGREMLRGSVLSNAVQPRVTVADDHNGGAKLLTTGWHHSARFTIPVDWESGFYLVKLEDDDTGAASYATFTVRSLTPAPVVVVVPTNTWQAYNTWGRLSLYRDLRASGRTRTDQHTVAHIVSFHRPYDEDGGAGQFFRITRPLVSYLESRGYPVSYATDDDVRADTVIGEQTKLVVLEGHSEYHDHAEISHIQAWRRAGVDIALLGGNDFVWQARFDDRAHTMAVWRYKSLDPLSHGKRATVRWERVGWPQNTLTGTMQAWGTPTYPQRAYATTAWPWRGASVGTGTPLAMPQGNEFDGMVVNNATSTHEIVLSRAPLGAGGVGGTTQPYPTHAAQEMTLTSTPGKGWVFSAGQNDFTWLLDYPGTTPARWIDALDTRYPTQSRVSQPIRRLVGNLIEKATGYPNPEPALPPAAPATPPLRILAPANHQPVYATPGREGVMWSDAPAQTNRIIIRYDGHRVAVASPHVDVWVGRAPTNMHGWHTITLTARDGAGRVLTRSHVRVQLRPPTDPIFLANHLARVWNDDTEDEEVSRSTNAKPTPAVDSRPEGMLLALGAAGGLIALAAGRRWSSRIRLSELVKPPGAVRTTGRMGRGAPPLRFTGRGPRGPIVRRRGSWRAG